MNATELVARAKALGFTHYKTAGGLAPLADFAAEGGPYGPTVSRLLGLPTYDGTLVVEGDAVAIRDSHAIATHHGRAFPCWPLAIKRED